MPEGRLRRKPLWKAHRTGSEALTQPRQELDAGVAVGGLHADLALEFLDRGHGVVADAAIGAAGVETKGGEALLDLLHFGERRRALAAGEGLRQRPGAHDAI